MADELGLGQIVENFDELAPEAVALGIEPFLAGGVADRDAFEEFPLVEIRGREQRLVFAGRGQAFEFVRVDLDYAGIQANRGAIDLQGEVGGLAEGLADRGQALAQRIACLFLAAVAPQQVDQPFARMPKSR